MNQNRHRRRARAIALPDNRNSRRLTLAAGVFLALAALMLLLAVKPASAGNGLDPNYRFCVSGNGGPFGPDIPDCAYNTWQQCQFSASGNGYCIENPGYAGRLQRRVR